MQGLQAFPFPSLGIAYYHLISQLDSCLVLISRSELARLTPYPGNALDAENLYLAPHLFSPSSAIPQPYLQSCDT